MKSSFEEFTQNVIHPLESSSVPGSARVPTRNQTLELEPLPQPKRSGSAKNRSTKSRRLPTSSLTPAAVEGVDLSSRRSHSPRLTNLLLVGNAGWYSPHSRRPRANTNEDRRSQHSKSGQTQLHLGLKVCACLLTKGCWLLITMLFYTGRHISFKWTRPCRCA